MFEFIERIGQKRLDLRYWASMVANPPMCQWLKCRASLFSEPRWRPVGRAVGTAKRSVPVQTATGLSTSQGLSRASPCQRSSIVDTPESKP